MKKFSAQDVPSGPGVYVFRNSAGTPIYVGKAKSLRKRLATYFQPSRQIKADAKLRALINSIDAYEVFPVKSEAEALLLESRLIKEYHPRYNVELRDDKRFLHICVDTSERFPRLRLSRLRKDDGRVYFGPFPRAGVLRGTVIYLNKRFGLRTCSVQRPDKTAHRHCLKHAIKACSCPCVGKVDPAEYRERLENALAVLNGDTRQILDELGARMAECAERKEYEEAARTRDMIENLRFVCAPARRTFTRTTLDSALSSDGALTALRAALGLPRIPSTIECFDISNIRGRLAVGSMIRFQGGRPFRRGYRRYRIKSQEARDDSAMVQEVIQRRYARLIEEGRALPDLIVVDGGAGQLDAAVDGLRQAGVPPLPVLALAKKQEEIYLPGRVDPLVLERDHAGLRLLQAIRDEAHRFALTYHRNLRRRRIANSLLAEIEGVGPKRQQQLLRHFGSVRNLRRATPQALIAAVPGLGPKLATRIHAFLREHDAASAPPRSGRRPACEA